MSSPSVYSPRGKLALFAKKRMGGRLGTLVKRAIATPRFRKQLSVARAGFQAHGSNYPHPILYVAGMPKSGTTWLDGMLAMIPGYGEVMLPEAVFHELRHHETLTFQMPKDAFERLAGSLTVLRLHATGSDHNAGLLEQNDVPYVVLYRDLRDVAVSHHFYVGSTPWHPEYDKYHGKSVEEGLGVFARDLLDMHVQWILDWRSRSSSPLCMIVTYEQLKVDPDGVLLAVLRHYGIPGADELAPKLVAANSFERLSQGGKDGFFRKGSVGDWENHMTPELAKVYADAIARSQV